MNSNTKMSRFLRKLDMNKSILTPRMLEACYKGFFEYEGHIVLAFFIEGDNSDSTELKPSLDTAPSEIFIDKTGFECFANKFHLADFTDKPTLESAILMLKTIFTRWKERQSNEVLRGIISKNRNSIVIRVHKLRDKESWLSDDLEGYRLEGILVVDSNDPHPLFKD